MDENIESESWLLIDTASPRAVVGVTLGDTVVSEIYLEETFKHGERLADAIERCLEGANLSFGEIFGVAVGKGPGSFIGTRIGIAQAKGLSLALSVPLVGIGTLESLFWSAKSGPGEGIVLIDARRGEYFVQEISLSESGELQDCAVKFALALPPSEALRLCRKKDHIIGYGLDGLTEHASLKSTHLPGPSAFGTLCALRRQLSLTKNLIDETFSLIPDYCRKPDAKVQNSQ